jgi:hypothetical protein
LTLEAITLSALFQAPQLLRSVSGILGVVESDSQKIDKLLKKDFEVGIRYLQDLLSAGAEPEYFLRTAWEHFAAAVSTEDGVRKAKSYLLLAFCQYRLGHKRVALATLNELSRFQFVDKAARTARSAGGVYIKFVYWPFRPPKAFREAFNQAVPSEQIVEELKQETKSLIAAIELEA